MKVASFIKEKFGQDINYVDARIAELQRLLGQELSNPYGDEVEITYTRGRLLRYMQQAIDITNDPAEKRTRRQALNSELNMHKQQISHRIKYDKHVGSNTIPKELGLKIKRSVSAHKQIFLSNDGGELASNIANSVGNTASIVGTMAKVPAIAITKLVGVGIKLAAVVATAPAHIYGYLFSKLLRPNSPYEGKAIKAINNGLKKAIDAITKKEEEIIKRL